MKLFFKLLVSLAIILAMLLALWEQREISSAAVVPHTQNKSASMKDSIFNSGGGLASSGTITHNDSFVRISSKVKFISGEGLGYYASNFNKRFFTIKDSVGGSWETPTIDSISTQGDFTGEPLSDVIKRYDSIIDICKKSGIKAYTLILSDSIPTKPDTTYISRTIDGDSIRVTARVHYKYQWYDDPPAYGDVWEDWLFVYVREKLIRKNQTGYIATK